DLYLADVRQGETSILVSGVKVQQTSPAPIEVRIASDGGIIEGIVANQDKSPLRGGIVVLFAGEGQSLRVFQTTTAGADGKYAFRGVRPGEYKLLAGPGPIPPGGIPLDMLAARAA